MVGWRFIGERRAVSLDPNCGWTRGKADVAEAIAVGAGGASFGVPAPAGFECGQPGAPQVDVHFLQPYGVRGWLLWFALSLAVGPIYFVGIVINEHNAVAVSTVPGLESIVLAETIAYLGLAALSLTAAVLIFMKARASVPITQTFLILQLVAQVALAGLASSSGQLPEATKSVLIGAYVQGATKTAVISAVWLLYLVRSKRVHNTLRVPPTRLSL